jgi:hypothetical protein
LDVVLEFIAGAFFACERIKDGVVRDRLGHVGVSVAAVNYFYSRNFWGSVVTGLLTEAASAAIKPSFMAWGRNRFNRKIDRMLNDVQQG